MPKITYEFIASGHKSVEAAIDGIGQKTERANKIADAGVRRMRENARETTRSASSNASHQQRLAEKVARDQEKHARHVAGIRDRYFAEEQKKSAQAERVAQRETTRALQTKRRAIAAEIGEKQKHENKLQDIARRASDKRAEGERRHQQTLTRIREDSEKRLARITDQAKSRAALRDETRAFDVSLTQKKRAYEIDKKRADIQQKARESVRDDIRGGLKNAVIGGGVALGALGAGVVGAASRDAMRLQEVSNRLSINARGAGEQAVDPAQLRREFQQTAIRTPGVQAIDIADAVSQFVSKTGNLDVARKSQGVFATVASATGSSVQDVATAAADLFEKFDINTVEGMADAMSALAFQGKAGAFELKDAASQFASLASAAARFGLDKGAEGVRVLGGLTQIARTGNKGPEATATAVNAMFRQFTSASTQKELANLGGVGKGVKVFKDKGHTQTKDIRDLIVETISKAGGDQTKIGHIFGDEGMGAMSPMLTAFNTALKEATDKGLKGSDANKYAEKALRDYIEQKINAPGDYKELQKDAAQAQADASAKLTATWESLTAKIGEGTIPILQQFADTLGNSPDAIDAFVGTVDNLTTAFGFLIKGIEAWAEFFNISSKKKKSPDEVLKEERNKAERMQSDLAAFDRKRGGSWDEEQKLRRSGKKEDIAKADAMAKKLFATAYMDEERKQLERNFMLQQKVVGEAQGAVETTRDQQKNVRSAGAFAEEYARLLKPEEYAGQNQSRADLVAKVLRDQTLNENQYTGKGMLEGETEQAQAFRLNQLQARKEQLGNAGIAQQGQAGQSTADTGLSAAIAKLAAAAGKLDSAAGKMGTTGQPSIVGSAG